LRKGALFTMGTREGDCGDGAGRRKERAMKVNRRRFLKLASSLGVSSLLFGYPVVIERNRVMVNRYRIPVPHLPEPFRGFTLVHLTDIHYGPLVSLHMVRQIVGQANRLKKDAVVCTGDYVHERNKRDQIDRVGPVLSELTARSGVYSVLGNHDHWADPERSRYWLKRSGQDLSHRLRAVERGRDRIWLAGAGDLWEDHEPLDRLLGRIPPEDCRIVLAHNPDTADTDYEGRVDLMICGHTHGGQVNIPFIGPPVLPVKNKDYSSGLKSSPRGTRVFISKGLGWSICPVRFNCLPEIAVLELIPDVPEVLGEAVSV